MARYVKKPIVVEAVQWTGDNIEEINTFLQTIITFHQRESELVIPTLEGDMIASKGDYIIRGIKNEYYPCKPDIFEASYSIVEEYHE